MKADWLVFLLEASCCMVLLFGIYAMLFRRLSFFNWNRFVLLLIPIFSVLIPLLPAHFTPALEVVTPSVFAEANNSISQAAFDLEKRFDVNWAALLWYIYWAGVVVFAIRFFLGLGKLLGLMIRGETKRDGLYYQVKTEDNQGIASFFQFILIPQKFTGVASRMVLDHEKSHIRLKHSHDLIFMAVTGIFFWFNPVVYGMRKALVKVHEFAADRLVVHSGTPAYEYGKLLVEQSLPTISSNLTHSFHDLSAERLSRLVKSPSSNWLKGLYLLFLPVVLFLVLAFRSPDWKFQIGGSHTLTANEMKISTIPYRFTWGDVQTERIKENLLVQKKDLQTALEKPLQFVLHGAQAKVRSFRVGVLKPEADAVFYRIAGARMKTKEVKAIRLVGPGDIILLDHIQVNTRDGGELTLPTITIQVTK